jgi:hypothetical protein
VTKKLMRSNMLPPSLGLPDEATSLTLPQPIVPAVPPPGEPSHQSDRRSREPETSKKRELVSPFCACENAAQAVRPAAATAVSETME